MKSNNFFQFEVFLKEEDEMTKLSRATDHSPLEREVMIRSSVVQMEDSISEGKIMKRPVRKESPTKDGAVGANVERVSWSVREVEWCTAEKRLLFSAKDNQDACMWISEFQRFIEL